MTGMHCTCTALYMVPTQATTTYSGNFEQDISLQFYAASLGKHGVLQIVGKEQALLRVCPIFACGQSPSSISATVFNLRAQVTIAINRQMMTTQFIIVVNLQFNHSTHHYIDLRRVGARVVSGSIRLRVVRWGLIGIQGYSLLVEGSHIVR